MSPATRNPPEGGVRTDLEPLVSRFPDLGSPVSAAWQSGTVGTSLLPPTIYWIDAVVTLEPATATTLRAASGLAPTDPPRVAADLESFFPPGNWTTGPELSTSFSLVHEVRTPVDAPARAAGGSSRLADEVDH